MTRRPLTPGAMALLVVLCALSTGSAGVAVVAGWDVPGPREPSAAPGTGPTWTTGAAGAGGAGATSVAREVLRVWDRDREAAWADRDEAALAALYLPDAVAGRRDVALLRRWAARGARVTRLEPQVLALRVLHDRGRGLLLEVTDRLVMEAEVAGEPVTLPRDRPTTRRIELRRGPHVASRWRVAAVRGVRGLAPPATIEE